MASAALAACSAASWSATFCVCAASWFASFSILPLNAAIRALSEVCLAVTAVAIHAGTV